MVKPRKGSTERDGVPWSGGCPMPGCVLANKHDGPCKIGNIEEEDYEIEVRVRSGDVRDNAARRGSRPLTRSASRACAVYCG